MTVLKLLMTTIGLGRFSAAQVDEGVDLTIATVGLSNADFVIAPSLTALPGEFRRIATVSGVVAGDGIVHLVVEDSDEVTYTARAFGLFLADGTLFAVYGQESPIVEKATGATLGLALDIAFPIAGIDQLTFGSTNFLNPPGTKTVKGVMRFATSAERAAGSTTDAAVTPADLRWLLPIGTIILWYGSAATVPAAWAICDGRTVARSDGQGAIDTPDLRDRVPVGAGGAHTPGDRFGRSQQTTASAGAHDHGVDLTGHTDAANTGITIATTLKTETAGGGTDRTLKTVDPVDPGHGHAVTLTGATASAGAHDHAVDVTQPSVALFFIMKV